MTKFLAPIESGFISLLDDSHTLVRGFIVLWAKSEWCDSQTKSFMQRHHPPWMVSLQFQIYYINAMRLKRQSTRRQCVQYNITWHGEKQQWDGDRETISNRDDAPTWYALGSSSTLVMEPYHLTLCCRTRLLWGCHLYCHKNMRRSLALSLSVFPKTLAILHLIETQHTYCAISNDVFVRS